MRYPLSTGDAAQLLGTTEPKLAEAVRRGRVSPLPPVRAGRRLWSRVHLLQAARFLGVDTATVEAELELFPANAEEVPRG